MKKPRIPKGEYSNTNSKEKQGTGGLVLSKESMKPALPHACVECPLRRDAVPGYLGGYTPEMYVEVLHSPASLACHASPGFHEGDIGRQHHCTGVAAYRANVGHICQHRGHQTLAHESTKLIGSDDRFFESPEEFIAYHKPHQKRVEDGDD